MPALSRFVAQGVAFLDLSNYKVMTYEQAPPCANQVNDFGAGGYLAHGECILSLSLGGSHDRSNCFNVVFSREIVSSDDFNHLTSKEFLHEGPISEE